MQDKDVCALCILVKSERSEPRLVSLVPFPRQYQSLGLGMIELPYCDDIRHPEERTEFLGSPVSSDEQTIRLASEIIQENQIPSQYSSGGIHNPQARRHFTILECVATGGEWNDESQLPQLDKEMLLVQNDRKEYLIASFVVSVLDLIDLVSCFIISWLFFSTVTPVTWISALSDSCYHLAKCCLSLSIDAKKNLIAGTYRPANTC